MNKIILTCALVIGLMQMNYGAESSRYEDDDAVIYDDGNGHVTGTLKYHPRPKAIPDSGFQGKSPSWEPVVADTVKPTVFPEIKISRFVPRATVKVLPLPSIPVSGAVKSAHGTLVYLFQQRINLLHLQAETNTELNALRDNITKLDKLIAQAISDFELGEYCSKCHTPKNAFPNTEAFQVHIAEVHAAILGMTHEQAVAEVANLQMSHELKSTQNRLDALIKKNVLTTKNLDENKLAITGANAIYDMRVHQAYVDLRGDIYDAIEAEKDEYARHAQRLAEFAEMLKRHVPQNELQESVFQRNLDSQSQQEDELHFSSLINSKAKKELADVNLRAGEVGMRSLDDSLTEYGREVFQHYEDMAIPTIKVSYQDYALKLDRNHVAVSMAIGAFCHASIEADGIGNVLNLRTKARCEYGDWSTEVFTENQYRSGSPATDNHDEYRKSIDGDIQRLRP